MATFIVQGNFTAEAVRGMLAKPEDRSKVIAKLISAAGGKLRETSLALVLTLACRERLPSLESPLQIGPFLRTE